MSTSKLHRRSTTLASLAALLLLAVPAAAEDPPAQAPTLECASLDAKALLDRADDVYRGTSSKAEVSMKVVTEHYTREMTMKAWSKGTEKSLLRITAPKKEKGMATLMAEDNVWNWLPKVGKVIKVPSSMMGGSWMGSHFTNDDLVKQNRMTEDFTFDKTFSGERDGHQTIELTCTPKPEAAIVWGKIVVEIDAGLCLPYRQKFYDEDGELVRTMLFDEVKQIGERKLPMLMRVQPEDKPNELTEVRYHSIEFDLDVKDSLFSIRSLKK